MSYQQPNPSQPQFENQQRWGTAPPPVQPPKPKKNRGRLVAEIVGAVVLLSIGVGIGGAGDSSPVAAPAPTATVTEQVPGPVETVEVEVPGPETTVTVTAQPPKPKAPTGFGDGMYLVGEDIKPGRYKTSGPSDADLPNCYWARLKNTDGDFDAIIANGAPDGTGFVTIKSSDVAFETSGCAEWVKVS